MRLHDLLLTALRTDTRTRKTSEGWLTRCLHCGSPVGIRDDGTPIGHASLEHIVPRSWFDRRAAAALVARVGAPEDPRNLALACATCNQQKGRTHDARGPADPRAVEVITALLDRRLSRFRS